jgi:hypothetical protein
MEKCFNASASSSGHQYVLNHMFTKMYSIASAYMKMTAFWDVMPCCLVERDLHSRMLSSSCSPPWEPQIWQSKHVLYCPYLLRRTGVLTENLIYLMQHTQQGHPNIRLIFCCSFTVFTSSPDTQIWDSLSLLFCTDFCSWKEPSNVCSGCKLKVWHKCKGEFYTQTQWKILI